MHNQDVLALFVYNYWATFQILAAVKGMPLEEYTASRQLASPDASDVPI